MEWADRNGYSNIGSKLAESFIACGDKITDGASAFKQIDLYTGNIEVARAAVEYHNWLVRMTSPAMNRW